MPAPDTAPAAGKEVPDPPPPPARKLVTHGAALCAKADGDGLTERPAVVEIDVEVVGVTERPLVGETDGETDGEGDNGVGVIESPLVGETDGVDDGETAVDALTDGETVALVLTDAEEEDDAISAVRSTELAVSEIIMRPEGDRVTPRGARSATAAPMPSA